MAGQYYQVQECEYLSQIAARFGFASADTIWNDPKNASLKAKRQYYNVLNPGDVVYIPDKAGKQESRSTTQVSNFVLKGKTIALKIVVKTIDDQSVANASCTLSTDAGVSNLTTDGAGTVNKPDLPLTTKQADLKIESSDLPLAQWEVTLHIGCLDTEDTRSGQTARLNNLGYFAGDTLANDKQFQWAVEEFQCDHMGPSQVSGVCDKTTQSKLVEVHGS